MSEEIRADIGELKGIAKGLDDKLDMVLATFKDHIEDDRRAFDKIDTKLAKLDERVGRVDGRLRWAFGGGTAIIFIIGLLTHLK